MGWLGTIHSLGLPLFVPVYCFIFLSENQFEGLRWDFYTLGKRILRSQDKIKSRYLLQACGSVRGGSINIQTPVSNSCAEIFSCLETYDSSYKVRKHLFLSHMHTCTLSRRLKPIKASCNYQFFPNHMRRNCSVCLPLWLCLHRFWDLRAMCLSGCRDSISLIHNLFYIYKRARWKEIKVGKCYSFHCPLYSRVDFLECSALM